MWLTALALKTDIYWWHLAMTQSWEDIARRQLDGYRKWGGKPEAWSNRNGMEYYRKAAGVSQRRDERKVWLLCKGNVRLLLPKSRFIYSQEVTKGQILNAHLSFTIWRWGLSKQEGKGPCLLRYETVSPKNVVSHVRGVLGDLDLTPPVSQFGAENNGQAKIFHASRIAQKEPFMVIYQSIPGPGAGQTTLSAPWQPFNLFSKRSDGGPTAPLANLRWCLENSLTDEKFSLILILVLFS